MILLLRMYGAHATLWLKRLSFVAFHYSSHNMSPWAGLEDADSDYKCKEAIAGNITKTGHESWGHFLNVIKPC